VARSFGFAGASLPYGAGRMTEGGAFLAAFGRDDGESGRVFRAGTAVGGYKRG